MTWVVYILQSEVDGRLYTGMTDDLDRRLAKHNAGKGAKATRPWRPWRVVHTEGMNTKGEALRREAAIKRLSRARKLGLIRDGTPPRAPNEPSG